MNEKWKNLDAGKTLKLVFWLMTFVCLVMAVVAPDRAEMLSGLKAIYTTPGKGGNEIRVAYVNNCEDLTRSIELLKMGIEAYNAKKVQA